MWIEDFNATGKNIKVNIDTLFSNENITPNHKEYYINEENSYMTKVSIDNEEILVTKDFTKPDKITKGNASLSIISNKDYKNAKVIVKNLVMPDNANYNDLTIKLIDGMMKSEFLFFGYGSLEGMTLTGKTNITKDLLIEAKTPGTYTFDLVLINAKTSEELLSVPVSIEAKETILKENHEESLMVSESLEQPLEVNEGNSNLSLNISSAKDIDKVNYIIDNLILPEGATEENIKVWIEYNEDIYNVLELGVIPPVDFDITKENHEERELLIETDTVGNYKFDISVIKAVTEEEIARKTIEFEVLEETTEEN